MLPPLRYVLVTLILGSLFVMSVYAATLSADKRMTRLDALVALTPEQQAKATEIFQTENQFLDALSENDRLLKGIEAREKSRQEIRALLSPAQRSKYDLSPQSLGGGLKANPDNIVNQLDQLLGFSPAQKLQVRDVLWKEFGDQLAAIPEGGEPKGFAWREATRDQIRALLTPEQLDKYNRTPQIEGGAARPRNQAPKAPLSVPPLHRERRAQAPIGPT